MKEKYGIVNGRMCWCNVRTTWTRMKSSDGSEDQKLNIHLYACKLGTLQMHNLYSYLHCKVHRFLLLLLSLLCSSLFPRHSLVYFYQSV